MPRVQRFYQLSILILAGGILLANLFVVDSALATESDCDPKILSLFPCASGSESERSFVNSSARSLQEEKKNLEIDIEGIDSIPGTSHVIAKNNNGKNHDDANIESLIPSTINAIPFP
ncbi:MAG: hypothetical protein ACRD8W_03695 [Nitrososphaeraceae archaeon]